MELQIFTSFQFCILLVWSANGDAPFQGNLLNDDTYRWNCVTSSYGLIGRAKQLRIAYILLWYVQIFFLQPVQKAERNFEIAVGTLCLRVRRYASLYTTAALKIPFTRQHFSSRILLDRKLSESYFF